MQVQVLSPAQSAQIRTFVFARCAFYASIATQFCRYGVICEHCGGVGEIAHHKVYLNRVNVNKPEIALSFDNLECLCLACHNAEHNSAGIRLDELVKKLLSLSKIEERPVHQEYSEFDLSKLLHEAVTTFQPIADAKGKAIVCETLSTFVFLGDEGESGGYGIGLSIARAIAKSHKGNIQAVYENENRIICFHVQLPK